MRVHLQRLKGKLFKEERENEKCSMDVLDRPFSVVWSIFGYIYLSNAGDGQKESQAGAAASGVWDCKKDAAPRARSPVQAFSRC